jgi:hypothetical protein
VRVHAGVRGDAIAGVVEAMGALDDESTNMPDLPAAYHDEDTNRFTQSLA